MKQGKKISNKEKKKIIIALFSVVVLIILMLITAIIFFSQNGMNEENSNILYYNENKEKEENNMLVVNLSDKNETNENNEVNNTVNNTVDTNTTTDGKTEISYEMPYYIKVNNQANTVTVYKKDSNGKYTVPIKAMICSIGDATPESGVYKMSIRYTWRLLQGNVYGQYACKITGNILFHSVPYTKQDKSALEWWEYDKLGTKASLGCIRLKVEDAKWIYENCKSGTQVEFYYASNPGPLGKPTAKKISSYENLRNWDPTDPDPNNPWKNYDENSSKTDTNKPSTNQTNTNQQNKNEANTNQLNTNTNQPNTSQTMEQNVVDTSTNVATESKPENELNSVKNDNIV